MEKAVASHSSTLAWKIPRTEEPGRLQSMGLLRVGHDWATSLSLFTFLHWRRKWQPTPVFLPGESQGRGAWWAAVYGVTHSRTRLKRLSSSSSNWEKDDPDRATFQISANIWNMSKFPVFIHRLHNSSLALNAATLPGDLNSCHSPLNCQTEFTEQVECVTQVRMFFDTFCVTKICCQWWLLFWKKSLE